MAKFSPVKERGTVLERWKDETTGKKGQKTGLLIPRKIRKRKKTRVKREKKDGKEKSFFKRECVLPFFVLENFYQRTCLVDRLLVV